MNTHSSVVETNVALPMPVKRIILLEWDHLMRQSLTHVLNANKIDVIIIDRPEHVFELLKQQNATPKAIDGILVSTELPDMPLALFLQQIDLCQSGVAIFLLGRQSEIAQVVQYFRYGIADYFEKPVSLPAITQAILSL